jgi:hypothetical protein
MRMLLGKGRTMSESEDWKNLMSLLGEEDHPRGPHNSLLWDYEDEICADLISLLLLPELQEKNNPDLPFEVVGWYRGSVCGDSIQTLSMERVRYDRESALLAEWIGRLTRNPRIICFDKDLATEFAYPDGGLLHLRLMRSGGTNSLFVTCDGAVIEGETIEVWEQGALLRRTDLKSVGGAIQVTLRDGIAMVVRRGSADAGVEVLTDEGEFGSVEWMALIAGLCLQGSLPRAIQLLNEKAADLLGDSKLLARFHAFLRGLAAVTRSEGYALRPLPVVRSSETTAHTALPTKDSIPPQIHEAWQSGWGHLALRDFTSACELFSSFQTANQQEWRVPMEERLAHHFEMLAERRSPKEEARLTVEFWEDIFGYISGRGPFPAIENA